MSDFLVEQQEGVLRVTINHPERGNGMTDAMAAELTRIIDGAAKQRERDGAHRRRRGFLHRPPPRSGRARRRRTTDALGRRDVSDTIFNCYGAFRRCAIPIIGVVRGRALGFGCAIAALCDMTIAGERAQFQVPEYAHNIMPTMVMSALIDRVHRKALTYLVYSTTDGQRRARAELRPRQRGGAGGRARRHCRAALPDDPEGAAHRDRGREGLHALGARHGDRRRGRLRPQPACHRQRSIEARMKRMPEAPPRVGPAKAAVTDALRYRSYAPIS